MRDNRKYHSGKPGKYARGRSDDKKPPARGFEKPHFDKARPENARFEKPRSEKPRFDKARPEKPRFEKPRFNKPRFDKPRAHEPYQPRDGVLLWGLHAARAAWLNPRRRCFRMWLTEAGAAAFAPVQAEARDALLKRPDPKRSERHEIERLLPPASVHQGIVLEAAPLPEPPLHEVIAGDTPPDIILVLDQVTDPHNVGAILRSAAAFGAGAVILTERNAPGATGVMAKAASGALDHVPLVSVVNLARALDELREAGYWCVGLAEEGEKNLGALDLTGRTALVLGAEGEGLRQLTRKKCDELARLPTGGPIGSLNVSNAAAAALYEVRRQKSR